MEQLFTQLLDILTEEQEIYAALLELSDEKQKAVVSSALDSLGEIVRREQVLISRLQDREKLRAGCVSKLAALTGTPGGSLQELAERACPQGERARLESVQRSLSGLIARLQEKNETNRSLIESRLQYVQFVMDQAIPGAATHLYGAQGEDNRPDRPGRNLYDQKV